MRLIIRGGQTLAHVFCMGWQVVQLIALVGIVSWGALLIGNVGYHATPTTKAWIIPWAKAAFLHTVSPDHKTTITRHGQRLVLPVRVMLLHPHVQAVTRLMKESVDRATWGALAIMSLFAFWITCRGYWLRRDRLLSGTYLASQKTLQKKIKQRGHVGDHHLAGIHLADNAWHQHVLVHGSTGTGKSIVLRQLCDQIRARGDKAIVYDQHQGFLPYYYREGKDKLLNPFDNRCVPWDLWHECPIPAQLETLAKALIPSPIQSGDPFWTQAARTVFVAMAKVLKNEEPNVRMARFVDTLLMSSLSHLSQLLKNTEAQSLVSPEVEKMALSIQGVLASTIRPLGLLQHTGQSPFSIGEWLLQPDDSWLFITGRDDMADLLRPLLSMWLDTLASRLLALPVKTHEARIWLILDELPSLQRLPSLVKCLAESRKFGGCVVMSTQTIFQLQQIYGHDDAKAIADLCNTRLFFRSPSEQTAGWVSRELGQGFWLEVQESMSYGASRFRDGVNLTHQRVNRPAVRVDVIQHLPDRQAILQVPPLGKSNKATPITWPVAKVKVPWCTPQAIADAFIPVPEPLQGSTDRDGKICPEDIAPQGSLSPHAPKKRRGRPKKHSGSLKEDQENVAGSRADNPKLISRHGSESVRSA
jgi:type IV conjugative transfer system coupling protein TraD